VATVYNVKKLSVQWQAGNQCNFRCDYCHSDYHNGSNPFLDYDQFHIGFDNLKNSTVDYDSLEIEFQGGEPTISSAVRDTIIGSTDPRIKYVLTTNASASLDWWQLAVKNLSTVILAYHPNSDITHFHQVIEIVKASGVPFAITINAHTDPSRWDQAVDLYDHYKTQSFPINFKALFSNHNKGNDKFLNYNVDQWSYWLELNKIQAPEAPVETQIKWVEDRLYNNYKGHLCWAGVEQIVIDYFGYVYRGWCHANGGFGNIFGGPIILDKQPTVCPRLACKNTFDQLSKKSTNSWGFS